MRPPLNCVAVPGIVAVEECSLDLIFYKGQLLPARQFGFLMGEGLFFPIDETRFSQTK